MYVYMYVIERDLLEGFWSTFHSVVEWFQDREHPFHIVLSKVHPERERESEYGDCVYVC